MAIFHHSTQIIGRSSGRSSVGAAAYRLGVELVDQRTGQAFDYTRKAGVDSWHTIAPDNAPAWVNDAGELWNAVEASEKRKDAQLCREVNVALPRELTPDQMKALALDYAREQWASRGMVAVVAFHDLDSANPHFHAMLTMREIGPEGFGKKNRDWNDHGLATEYRAAWAEKTNNALERFGHASRIDHRSLIEQGITDREPTQHQGPTAAAMEKRGVIPDRTRIPSPTPPSMEHAAALAELKREREQQQRRQDMADAKATAAAAKQHADDLRQQASAKRAEAKASEAAAREQAGKIKPQRAAAQRRHLRFVESLEAVERWRKAWPIVARFYEPGSVRDHRERSMKAAKGRDQANANADRYQHEQERHERQARHLHGEADALASKAATAGQRADHAQAEVERLFKRHRFEAMTPEQQQRQRDLEAAEKRPDARAYA
ncbi:unnamed protein product [Brugia timori]|uniref:MobA_MobL domain-containing protein n=1 Tax=Brugia timori TaxID=42155 RepID=A0A0R3QAV1_9BILA|nr:unnamed protein product [Brugia timori]